MRRQGPLRSDVATVRRTLRAHRERLLALPNVKYLAIGRKAKAGRRQPLLSIRVFVAWKGDVTRRQTVPARLRAVGQGGRRLPYYIKTDVEETRPLRALALRGGDRIEGRRRGTAALAYRSPGGRHLLLTCAHVVASLDAWGIGDPVERAAGARSLIIGRVHRMIRIRTDRTNRWDAAVVRVDVPADRLVVGDPPLPVLGHGSLRAGAEGRFFYVSGGARVRCAHPEVVETPVEIDYGAGQSASYLGFVLLEVSAGAPIPAHSGSLLVGETEGGVLGYGLVFAGTARHVAVIRLRETLGALSSAAASEDDQEEDVHVVF